MNNSFIEICIYEVKPEKADEFETLIKEVAEHHKKIKGVIDAKYIKRTYRQGDFNSVKEGKPAIRLTKKPRTITYVLYWELENEIVHGKATQSGLEKYYKRFTRCLTKMPKIILGDKLI